MLMLTSKSWTEKRSIVVETSSAAMTSDELLSPATFDTGAPGDGVTVATAAKTCRRTQYQHQCNQLRCRLVTTPTTIGRHRHVLHSTDQHTARRPKLCSLWTKLRVLDYEYICDRIAKFQKKIIFITRVINIQILTTKYFSFQYSITYCSQALRLPVHRARETVHLLTHKTPDFIIPALWPANSPDLNPVDYQIW